jgi:SOS response regulatory protein OraA/RecX
MSELDSYSFLDSIALRIAIRKKDAENSELHRKLAEQEGLLTTVQDALDYFGGSVEKKKDSLSAAKQEGYEQGKKEQQAFSHGEGYAMGFISGKQAGRYEVLRELSDRQPDAWVNISNTMGRRLSWHKNPQSNSHEVLIIRPSAPEKGENRE